MHRLIFYALFVPIVALLSVGKLMAQNPPALTLEMAIEQALRENIEIKNAKLEIVDADYLIVERRAWGLPQISANINFQQYFQVPKQPLPEPFVLLIQSLNPDQEVNREASFFLKNNFSPTVSAETVLFDGTYFVGLQAARAYKKYALREFETKVKQVKESVTDAFLPAVLLRENIQLLEKNIESLQKIVKETQALFENGFVEKLDVDRQLLSLANLEVEYDNLKHQYEGALNGLKLSIGLPQSTPLNIESDLEDLILVEFDQWKSEKPMVEVRPEFQLAQTGIELNEMNVKNFKAGYLPSIRLFGSYSQNYQGDNFKDGFWAPTGVFGFRVNVPIFDGLDKKAKIGRAKIDLEQAQNQLHQLKNLVNVEVENGKEVLIGAQKRYDNQLSNLELAKRIYETTLIKYKEGVGSSLEIIQAEQSLYATQRNYLNAIFDYVKAGLDLKYALGK